MTKKVEKGVFGEGVRGCLEFFRKPDKKNRWGGPFNGQKYRQCIFFDILYCFPIKAIVETGTFLGTTTAMFAATALPVHTVEKSRRYFSYAKTRFLLNRDNIHQYQNDSRSFLRGIGEDSSFPKKDVFFYLDAHWGKEKDLPLREELEIIFSNWERAIVMIDDFQVPDTDYGFDDHGPGKVLNLDYIEPVMSAYAVQAFFPSVNTTEETGAKRGSVILCQEALGIELDKKVKTLTRHVS